MEQGIITRTEGARLWVQCGDTEIPCVLRGKLKKQQVHVTSLAVVGDAVTVERLPDGGGVIGGIAARRSELSRPGFRGEVHVIAANLDQLVIVQAARQPSFKCQLVERFLAVAERGKMEPLVVVNKCDLAAETELAEWLQPLQASRVPVILTSTVDGRGLEELRERLTGRTSAFAGQSGVGKSSLVNALYPDFQARTSAVSASSHKGRHTTTNSQLYPLPGGGHVADTPGIRSLGLFEDGADDDVAAVFPEIAELAGACRFSDCRHRQEPQCAVKAAVERGEIASERYRHFLRLS